MIADYPNQKRDNAFHNQRIAVGSKHQFTVRIIALKPHSALAAVNNILFCLIFFVQIAQLVAQIDEQLVTVHPVVKVDKLGYYFLLRLIN